MKQGIQFHVNSVQLDYAYVIGQIFAYELNEFYDQGDQLSRGTQTTAAYGKLANFEPHFFHKYFYQFSITIISQFIRNLKQFK